MSLCHSNPVSLILTHPGPRGFAIIPQHPVILYKTVFHSISSSNSDAFQCLACAHLRGRAFSGFKYNLLRHGDFPRRKTFLFSPAIAEALRETHRALFKSQYPPDTVSTLRWGDWHVAQDLDEAAQMICSEIVHPDVICAIRPSCFFDIQEAQMFPTAAAQQQAFQQAIHCNC